MQRITLPEVCRVLHQYDVMWKLKQFSKKREKNIIQSTTSLLTLLGVVIFKKRQKVKKYIVKRFDFFCSKNNMNLGGKQVFQGNRLRYKVTGCIKNPVLYQILYFSPEGQVKERNKKSEIYF